LVPPRVTRTFVAMTLRGYRVTLRLGLVKLKPKNMDCSGSELGLQGHHRRSIGGT